MTLKGVIFLKQKLKQKLAFNKYSNEPICLKCELLFIAGSSAQIESKRVIYMEEDFWRIKLKMVSNIFLENCKKHNLSWKIASTAVLKIDKSSKKWRKGPNTVRLCIRAERINWGLPDPDIKEFTNILKDSGNACIIFYDKELKK